MMIKEKLTESAQCKVIVTRNLKNFAYSPVTAQTTEEFLIYYDEILL